jgi:hypothetical protein
MAARPASPASSSGAAAACFVEQLINIPLLIHCIVVVQIHHRAAAIIAAYLGIR